MSKIIFLVISMAIIAWIVCIDFSLKSKDKPFTWVDQNGCQYLVKNGGLTPRNHPNGTQICNK